MVEEEKSIHQQDFNVKDLKCGGNTQVVMYTDVSNYLDELLETIRIEKVFFTTLGRTSGFSEDFSQYQCHLCSHVISKQKWPTVLVLKIISHVKQCYNGARESKGKIRDLTTMYEFNKMFNSMVNTSKIIKEIFEFEELESVGSVFRCRECHWKYTIGFQKNICKIITTLFHHVQVDHGSNVHNIVCLKEHVTNYLDELLKTFQEHKDFLREESIVHGFGLNLTKYHCHFCSAVLYLEKAAPSTFVANILVHIKNCKYEKSKTTNESVLYSRLKDLVFYEFYNSMYRISSLVKDSLKHLQMKESDCKLFVCRICGWVSKFKFKNVGDVIERMLFHLKAKHFLIISDLQKFEADEETEDFKDYTNGPSSVLDYVYKNFKREWEINEPCESCWIFTGKQNMFSCRICEVTVNFPMDVIKFRNLVLSHHNFHKKFVMDIKNPSSPGNDCCWKLRSPDKFESLKVHTEVTEKTKEEGRVFLHGMFQKVKQFGLALLASRGFWLVGESLDEYYFSCTCSCKIRFTKFHPNEVTNFLVCHFNDPEHSNSYETFRKPKKVANTPKFSLIKLQATGKVVGFYGVYNTLDKNDKLIRLSRHCFAKKLEENLTLCIWCDLDIENGSNVFESRYFLWDHINSVGHKEHFPHLKKDLESLKTGLAAVLESDAQEMLSHLQIGPGSNFVKCGLCQAAVSMRFYAMKYHIERHTARKDNVRKITTQYVSKCFEKLFLELRKTLPEPMKKGLKCIKKGSIFGYVTCSLCCCAMVSRASHVESHLCGSKHVENSGGVWYE